MSLGHGNSITDQAAVGNVGAEQRLRDVGHNALHFVDALYTYIAPGNRKRIRSSPAAHVTTSRTYTAGCIDFRSDRLNGFFDLMKRMSGQVFIDFPDQGGSEIFMIAFSQFSQRPRGGEDQ